MKTEDANGLGGEARAAIKSAEDRTDEGQTLRERFRRTMHYERPDRLPNFEFGYWAETLPAWHEQGLPREIDNERKAYEYFAIENRRGSPVNVGLKGPFREVELVEETDDYKIVRDRIGVVAQMDPCREHAPRGAVLVDVSIEPESVAPN